MPDEMQLPKPQVRGVGTVTDPKTGEVMQIWIGKPPEDSGQSAYPIQSAEEVKPKTEKE